MTDENNNETKQCANCKEWKTLDFYNSNKTKVDGLNAECKSCSHFINKKWRDNNKEYNQNRMKLWEIENIEHRKKYRKEYHRQERSDALCKLYINYLRRIREMIPIEHRPKKLLSLLCCSIDDLMKHLEHQFDDKMNWSNNTIDGWHVDHIVPCDYFDLKNPTHQKRCFHWSNLQPLWGKENMSKSNKMLDKAYKVLEQLEYLFPDEPEYDSDGEEDYEEFRNVIPMHEICAEFL